MVSPRFASPFARDQTTGTASDEMHEPTLRHSMMTARTKRSGAKYARVSAIPGFSPPLDR